MWAALSIVTGTVVLALLRIRGQEIPLLWHFGVQTVAWGIVELLATLWRTVQLPLRDFASATALDRMLWFAIGLEIGCMALGVTLALAGWVLARRRDLVGSGLAIMVQAVALAILDLHFGTAVVR